MERELLKSKIHRARVTETDMDYAGSATIGRDLLEAADVCPHEKVQVVNVTNGERFETYAIEGEPGELCLNGAAARLAEVGDVVIVMTFARYAAEESPDPTVVFVDADNAITATE